MVWYGHYGYSVVWYNMAILYFWLINGLVVVWLSFGYGRQSIAICVRHYCKYFLRDLILYNAKVSAQMFYRVNLRTHQPSVDLF